MDKFTQKDNIGDIIRYELERNYTREIVVIKAGQKLEVGSLLGKVTADSKCTLPTIGEDDGSKKVIGILLENIDATDGDKEAVMLARGPAIILDSTLKYNSDATEENVLEYIKDLENLQILVRKGI